MSGKPQGIRCHGWAEAKSEADGQFDKAPNFNFNDGKVKFDTNDVDDANKRYGSSSGLLPKSLLNYSALPRREAS